MTDLLHRPATDVAPRGATGGRPLVVSALLASAGSFLSTLVTCLGLAVIGWFLADAGAHGSTRDALRVGADLWLVGHGTGLTVSGVPLGVVPWLVTAGLAAALVRGARWAAASSERLDDDPDADRTLLTAVAAFAGLYVVLALGVSLLAGTESAAPGIGRTVLACLLLPLLAGLLGLASGTGRLAVWAGRVPGWVLAVLHGGAATVVLLVGAGTLLVLGSLAWHLGDLTALTARLGLGAADLLVLGLACVAVLPNAALLGAAYLLGPGFAVGVGTTVAPSAVVLGPVPAFPLLAALPPTGPTPSWAMGLLAVPVLAAVLGTARAQLRYGVATWDSSALRGFGSGVVAAALTTLLVALAGGPMGTGRMAEIGAPVGEVLVAALLACCTGGLVSGSVVAWWQRRRGRASGAGSGS